ncbi:MAG TPA: TPM domain-containing protein [Bryobacteraceae bacterium]|jgi:uncharacterized protein
MGSRSAATNWPAKVSRFAPILAALLLAVSSAWAVDWKALKPEGYTSDFAQVIDPQSRAALDQYAANVEKTTGAQMAFVTIATLQGEPLEDVANDLFHAWGIGQKSKDNGVLLLLVIQDRRSRLEVGNGLEEILPDGFDGLLLENMRPELRANHYGPAMLTAAQAIGEVIAKAKGVTVAPPAFPAAAADHPHAIQHRREVPWGAILLGLFIFWILLRSSSRGGGGGGFWTGMLLGNLLNQVSYGGRGGGGFGGYDSGGSGGGFGGFGGGDSGGGGASSDW